MRRYDPIAMYPTMIIKARQHKADCSNAHVIRVKERLAMLNDVDALAARVKRLERQNQHLRLAVLGAVLAGMVILLMGAGKTQTVEAQKIVLLDRNGHPKLTIGTPAVAGATIDMKNPDDPVIWLSDEKGADRAMLTIDGLFFANGKAKPTVSLSSAPRSELKLYGSDGKVSWAAP
jgi:hypothetical protein